MRDELRRLQQLSGDLKQHNGTLANDLKLLRVQGKELTDENHSFILMNARLQQTVSACICMVRVLCMLCLLTSQPRNVMRVRVLVNVYFIH